MNGRCAWAGIGVALLLPLAAGCTRTSDGSYEPAYRFATTATPIMDWPVIEPSVPTADPSVARFPPPPPPPPLMTEASRIEPRRAPRRVAARSSRNAAPAHVFRCATADPTTGRARMECR